MTCVGLEPSKYFSQSSLSKSKSKMEKLQTERVKMRKRQRMCVVMYGTTSNDPTPPFCMNTNDGDGLGPWFFVFVLVLVLHYITLHYTHRCHLILFFSFLLLLIEYFYMSGTQRKFVLKLIIFCSVDVTRDNEGMSIGFKSS